MEANKLTCEQANQIDLVDFLNSLGYQSTLTRNHDYWYLSPLRNEKHASFKVKRKLNVWYDHGSGNGGTLVDFATQYFNCGVREALQKISFFHPQSSLQRTTIKHPAPHKSAEVNKEKSVDSIIKIIDERQGLTNVNLRLYALKRKIAQDIFNQYCSEVTFQLNGKIFRAIGFKNDAGGYELRNEFFKGSSSPKDVTCIDNKADTITVFEGFFDFLTYLTITQKQEQRLTNFLVLNSVSFFEKSLELMDKHECVKLFLDHDDAGKKYISLALNRSGKFCDESKLYVGHKDLNDYVIKLSKGPEQRRSFHL